MNRLSLLATTALCVAGIGAGASGASAAPVSQDIVSRLEASYSYYWWDEDNSSSDAVDDVYQGSAVFMKQFSPMWFGQADGAFVAQHIDWNDGGERWTVNSLHAGLTGFYRDPSWGLVGGEVAFNRISDGKPGPGARIGVRGEYFFSGNFTGGAAAGWHEFDFADYYYNYDGYYANAWLKYYLQQDLAFTLRLDGSSLNSDPEDYQLDQWDLTAEGEYLLPDCDTAIFAAVTYGNQDWKDNYEFNEWGLQIGLRFTVGQDGGLVQRDRTGALAPTVTGLRPDF